MNSAEAPKPNEGSTPPKRIARPFDEIQARFRSEPWMNPGGRFGYVDFTPPVLPSLEPDETETIQREEEYLRFETAMDEARKEVRISRSNPQS